MHIYEYVQSNWSEIKEDPLSDAVKKVVVRYIFALMQKKRFWNPEVADNLANEVLTVAAMRLFPDWEKVTAQAFAAFLIKTTKNVVKAFFRKFAIQKRKAQKAGEIIWKEAKNQTGSEK